MKAAVYHQYGPADVLQLTSKERPRPKDEEMLIKVHATTVTSGDVRLRSSDFPPLFWLPARLIFGLFRPKTKILGHEFSGVVIEKGDAVTNFSVGDEIFGTTTMLPTGAYAEYVCLPQKWKHGVLTLKPKNLDHSAAAALPIGAMTAMFLLEKATLKTNDQVLIYGASGSVGSYAVQLAKAAGANVTAVCSSKNFDMMNSLGVQQVIDYKTQSYDQLSTKFDIVFDAVGKTNKKTAKAVLKAGGNYVSVKMLTSEKSEHLQKIKTLAEDGQLKPFIDRSYPLEDIVKAHQYVDTGRKRGNVVIKVC